MCVFVCKDVCVCTCVKRKRTGVRKGKGGKLRRKGWIEIERNFLAAVEVTMKSEK